MLSKKIISIKESSKVDEKEVETLKINFLCRDSYHDLHQWTYENRWTDDTHQ